VNPAGNPPYQGDTGSVEGTISVDGDPPLATPGDFSRCPDAEKTWGKSFREGAPTTKGRALADAIAGITGYKGVFVPATRESVEIRIEGCAYTTRTAVLTFGQRLEVRNEAKDFWTPVLEPSTTAVTMMATPHGDTVKLYPKKLGQHLLLDRDRKYAVVDVYALRDPLHAVSDLAGHYRIDGIPVGKVTVNALHPRIDGETSADVEIRAGVVANVDLVLHHKVVDAGPTAPPATDAGGPQLH
jgi:hypothetical protein